MNKDDTHKKIILRIRTETCDVIDLLIKDQDITRTAFINEAIKKSIFKLQKQKALAYIESYESDEELEDLHLMYSI